MKTLWIGRCQPEEYPARKSGQRQGRGASDRDAQHEHQRDVPNDETRDSSWSGAEGHPHAELVRPPSHLKRQDPEHANRRDHERERAEEAAQRGQDSLSHHRTIGIIEIAS